MIELEKVPRTRVRMAPLDEFIGGGYLRLAEVEFRHMANVVKAPRLRFATTTTGRRKFLEIAHLVAREHCRLRL